MRQRSPSPRTTQSIRKPKHLPKQSSERGGGDVSMHRSNGRVHLRRLCESTAPGQRDLGSGDPGQQDGEEYGPGNRPSQAIFGGAQPPSTVMLRGAYHPAVAEALATQRAARPVLYRRSATVIGA